MKRNKYNRKPLEKDNFQREEEESGRIEGKNSVLESLKAGHTINKLYMEKNSKDPVLERIYAIARSKGIVVTYLEKSKLDTMSLSRNHQGVIADAAPYDYADVSDILKIAKDKGQPPFILILDGITDPNNLGSVI
ncbi:MAG: 23S rRNA (guanosine(2251)-2'-O)-methyltransferase RlmB, partial [Clostridiaceae bacterium]|nr:23S rRNA (guanosine(2251)-2'-O)-methyltransferase RlmB [Clostridiaceae bacterium]